MRKIKILTAPVNSGKSTKLFGIYKNLILKGIKPVGFISLPVFSENDKIGFELFEIHTNKKYSFITTAENDNFLKLGKYYIDTKIFEIVRNNFPVINNESIIFFDEFGILELQKKGWYELFDFILHNEFKELYIVVRQNLLNDFLQLINDKEFIIEYIQL